MNRVERHIFINRKDLDDICFLSKNLYNYCNYILRQEYIVTKKITIKEYDLTKQLGKEKQSDYKALPAQTAQQVIKLLYKNWKSFFNANKEYKQYPEKFKARPKLPKYKHKVKGRNIIIFTNQSARLKNGFIIFPKQVIEPLKTKVKNFQQVRIIPQSSCMIIEIVYKKEKEQIELNKNLYLGIDLGVNNLATLIINSGEINPVLINGKIIKSVNQYYNKRKAILMSYIGDKGISNRIKKLTYKRNNKITDYLHKTSRFIINYCKKHKIANIVIGHNKNWKQECNMGKVNNQKFVNIPFNTLIQQIQYKAEEIGINVIITEESYTSKIDHCVLEEMKHQDNYKGKRKYRGLFQSSKHKLINADVNGGIGILRKVIQNDFLGSLLDRGLVFDPLRVNPLIKESVNNC